MCAACVCQREPPALSPSVELTMFCFVFRLHPPYFLFVLALDLLPGGLDPPPHRFSFQLSTTMALAPPFPAGKGCNLPAGKHGTPQPRVCPPCVRVGVQGLPMSEG